MLNSLKKVRLWVGLMFLFSSSMLSAHVVKQVYGAFEHSGEEWSILVTFDIGLVEEDSRDPNTPQKERDYLFTLSDEKHAELREKAETLLRATISVEPEAYQVSFPDYDVTPYGFPDLLSGGAYLHVKVHGTRSSQNDLVFELLPSPSPHYVLKIGEEFKNVWPGDRVTLVQAGPAPIEEESAFDFSGFLKVGFLHVLPEGWDHVLFVIGLCLLQLKAKPVLWQSLVFTLAHSVTLGLAASGVLPQGGRWVEIFIAASIAVMGFSSWKGASLSRWRLLLVFVFGLIHGLGFAGALADPLRESSQFLPALAAMNLGVELAQVVVILAVLGLFILLPHERLRQTMALLIGLSGVVITLERLFS